MSEGPSVDKERPWLGLASFTRETREYFFGRCNEVAELEQRVVHKPLTVLYGQSGWGKTSLIQAALIPQLEERADRNWLPVHVRRMDFPNINEDSSESETDEAKKYRLGTVSWNIAAQVRRSLLESVRDHSGDSELAQKLEIRIEAGDELWALLHDKEIGFTAKDAPRPVFVFDQFEELFTLGSAVPNAVEDLIDELSGMVENRPSASLARRIQHDQDYDRSYQADTQPAHTLIVLREDYLGRLERYRDQMPSMMRSRVELRLLAGPAAVECVLGPGKFANPDKPLVSKEVAEQIVRRVADADDREPISSINAVPPLLSLVCRELNERRLETAQDCIEKSQVDLQHDKIIDEYYEASFDRLPIAVREVLEEKLLSPNGQYRESPNLTTVENHLRARGVKNPVAIIEDLDKNRRLITVENRGGRTRVEFTHDKLIEPAGKGLLRRQLQKAKSRRRRLFALIALQAVLLVMAITGLVATFQKKQAVQENLSVVVNNMSTVVETLVEEKAELKREEESFKAMLDDPAELLPTLENGRFERPKGVAGQSTDDLAAEIERIKEKSQAGESAK